MFKKLAKICAKFALGYLPDCVVYLLKIATDKASESEKAQNALFVIEQLSRDTTLIADAMKDGKLSDVEVNQIKMRASVLSEEIAELL